MAGSKPKTLYVQGSAFRQEMKSIGDQEQVVVIVTYENGAVSVTDNGRHCPFGYDQRMEVSERSVTGNRVPIKLERTGTTKK